ncbi:hypothetical protein BN1079_01832 [Pseudomonas saudiphocaensis]|uniref:Uncharacterized protein n=1 Tax=Pseudomonas saudiphocaensis TaxID=1499686 RepID=A0A078LTM8_9PSED|nr:hypothetical protein [Pseudomonas saudiphocaensis]CDZ94509.1 hypothetical protein BN1079_01832 [Pseudomonas saudiphocaensis]
MPTNMACAFGRASFTGMARSHEKQRGLVIVLKLASEVTVL